MTPQDLQHKKTAESLVSRLERSATSHRSMDSSRLGEERAQSLEKDANAIRALIRKAYPEHLGIMSAEAALRAVTNGLVPVVKTAAE